MRGWFQILCLVVQEASETDFWEPQLAPLEEMEQQLYFELLRSPAAHFGLLHPQTRSFGSYSKSMTIGENRNVDRLVNRERQLLA